jgi:hypothetical protein
MIGALVNDDLESLNSPPVLGDAQQFRAKKSRADFMVRIRAAGTCCHTGHTDFMVRITGIDSIEDVGIVSGTQTVSRAGTLCDPGID